MAATSDDAETSSGISGKAAVYVAAALIVGFLLYVGVGALSSLDCGGDGGSSYDPKTATYLGPFAPVRCRYKAR